MEVDYQFLIEKKLELFQTVAIVSITWWVSIVIFHGTFLAGVWLHHREIPNNWKFKFAFVLGGIFVGLSFFHGFVTHNYFSEIQSELHNLAQKAGYVTDSFDAELGFAKTAITNGTGAIGIILFLYGVMYHQVFPNNGS